MDGESCGARTCAEDNFSLSGPQFSTTVLMMGYVLAGGGLWGEKRVGLKPLFPAPAIMH
jgi:hypothetical protein